jgi:hypothetical protein
VYAIRWVQVNQDGLQLNDTVQVLVYADDVKKVKATLSGLYDTDARRHIVSLLLTEFAPSPESAAYQAGMSALC